jgi:sugar phosphate isomerase/epimerase
MRFGAPVWPFKWEEPYDGAIRRIRGLGFRAVELIGWKPETLSAYYTPQTVKDLRSVLDGEGMLLSQFVANPGELASGDAAVRAQAVENFKRYSDVGAALGTTIVNTVTHYPFAIRYPAIIDRDNPDLHRRDASRPGLEAELAGLRRRHPAVRPVRGVGRAEVQPGDAPVPLRRHR